MVVSVNAEIAFDRIPHLFMIETPASFRKRGELSQPDKEHLQKAYLLNMLDGETKIGTLWEPLRHYCLRVIKVQFMMAHHREMYQAKLPDTPKQISLNPNWIFDINYCEFLDDSAIMVSFQKSHYLLEMYVEGWN